MFNHFQKDFNTNHSTEDERHLKHPPHKQIIQQIKFSNPTQQHLRTQTIRPSHANEPPNNYIIEFP